MSTSLTTCRTPVADLLEQYATVVKADGQNQREFELTGTAPLRLIARWDEDWLLLRAPPDDRRRTKRPSPPQLRSLLRENSLPGGVKFGLANEPPWVRLLAEIAIEEETDLGPRLADVLDGFRRSAPRLDETGEPDGVPSEAPQAVQERQQARNDAYDPAELCTAAGWPFTERADGLVVPLDVPDAFCQAAVTPTETGLRLAVDLGTRQAAPAASDAATDVFLLSACSVIRMARARAVQCNGKTKYLWEVMLGGAPGAGEVGHALASLSVACRVSAREFRALQDETLARHYLAVRDWISVLGEHGSHNH